MEAPTKFESLSKLHPALIIKTICIFDNFSNESCIGHWKMRIVVHTFPIVWFEMIFSCWTWRPMKVTETQLNISIHSIKRLLCMFTLKLLQFYIVLITFLTKERKDKPNKSLIHHYFRSDSNITRWPDGTLWADR